MRRYITRVVLSDFGASRDMAAQQADEITAQ